VLSGRHVPLKVEEASESLRDSRTGKEGPLPAAGPGTVGVPAGFYTAPMPDMDLWPTGRLLSTAARLLEYAWNEKLNHLGLNHAGLIALDVLAANGSMTVSALARIVRVQAQTIGKTLTRLESHGYVRRRVDLSDRRSQVVSITDAGNMVREQARDLERSVLAGAAVDNGKLRAELQTIVLVLGTRGRRAGS
jgi:DNA-binding MarR family transcriptional regulator